nr:xylulose kinase-1 [Tanacetum cinerariifolium]
IVTQVTANVNNMNGGNGNGGNNGCSYKTFTACNPKEFDGKGGVVALNRWIEKMESMFDNSGCTANQGVRFYELAKLVPHLVTFESLRIKRYINGLAPQIRGTLTKGNDKRKEMEESRWGRIKGHVMNVGVLTIFAMIDPNGNKQLDKQGTRWLWRETRTPEIMGTTQEEGHLWECTDFSFISSKFAPLLSVEPCIVNPGYVIEIADSESVEADRVIRDCKLELGNSLFTIDLIPLGHGSFDVIVRMDWLSKNKVVIVCHEKVVEISIKKGGILRVQGERTLGATKALMNAKIDEPRITGSRLMLLGKIDTAVKNRNGHVSVITDTNGMIKVLPPKTTEEVMAREKERKARTTLLMALPEDHLAKFHKMADAKKMWEAIKSRFGGNNKSKKMQKYLLKQHFEGFSVSTSEGLHKGYDSFDDLYNNIRVFECDVKGITASSSNTQNMAFVSTDNTSSTNDFILLIINDDDMEEMDLKWQVAMISMRIKKFYKRIGRKLQFDTKDPVGFDMTKVECFNCHKMRHFARDYRAKGNQDSRRRDVGYNGNKARDNGRRPAYQDDSKALVTIDEEDIDWSGHVEEDAQNYAMMAYSSSYSGSDNKVKTCSKTCKESYARLKKLYDKQRDKMSRDVITAEQTHDEAMNNSIQNGDQP